MLSVTDYTLRAVPFYKWKLHYEVNQLELLNEHNWMSISAREASQCRVLDDYWCELDTSSYCFW